MKKIIPLFFSIFFVSHIFAADYTYVAYSFPSLGSFGSAGSACTAIISRYNQTSQTSTFEYKSLVASSSDPSMFTCNYKQTITSSGQKYDGGSSVARNGDSCPSGTEYVPAEGKCQAPPEPCKVGDPFPSKGTTGPIIKNGDRSYTASTPRTMCQNQCEYSDPNARPSGCYAVSDTEGYCNFIIKSTGKNCSSDDFEISKAGAPLNPPDTPNVPDSSPDPVCPPGWSVSNGTCFKNPPKFCDPSTGEICAPGTTDPNKPAPDAGTGGTEGTPGEGEGGRPDSSNGADKDLQDLQDSKPDAEACKPAADGSGCSGSTVKGEQCDKVVECTGDAVQCSILRQQKKMACAYEYEEARPFIEQQIAKEPYQVKSESVSGSELFTAGLNAPRWMPQGCPAPKSISIKGVSTSLSFEPACDFARGLGPLFVALASIFFAVYVGRAFGGN
ncbi:MAG: hypothetical protein KKA05_09060 [Alphaproteobacteria bacterium]|nr:hypothetical protein [Alphaproteobacteria bacterium]